VWESRAVAVAAAAQDERTLRGMTDEAMARVLSSEDLVEGLTAFIDKRDPVWKAR
jgi:enoyl-CoA hydratase